MLLTIYFYMPSLLTAVGTQDTLALFVIQVVNYLLRGWIGNLESKGSVTLPLLDDPENIQYGTTKDLEFVREGSKKSVRVHFYGSRFSLWNRIRSYVKSRFEALEINSR